MKITVSKKQDHSVLANRQHIGYITPDIEFDTVELEDLDELPNLPLTDIDSRVVLQLPIPPGINAGRHLDYISWQSLVVGESQRSRHLRR